MTPSFTVSQSAISPANVTLADTSTSVTGTITQRRAFFQTTSGSYLVQSGTSTDYEQWALADTSDTWDILTTDQAVSIRVDWLNVSNVVVESLTQVYCLPQFNKQFFYYLVQNQALTPGILQDTNYFSNMATYWMNITGAIQAVEIGADINASQNCLDRATNMMNNQSLFF